MFDSSKKEFIFEGSMVMTNEKICDVFIFCSGVKSIGYILEEEATKKRFIYYRRLDRNKLKTAEDGPTF